MPPSREHMQQAAESFSRILTEHNIDHAFIGGFALMLLESRRKTLDIDVEVDVDDAGELRGAIAKLLQDNDPRFVVSNLKLFFVPDGNWDARIPFETLARGTLGLPRQFHTERLGDAQLPILAPGVLILTKIKRATQYIGSTRPQSMHKFDADISDIVHLLYWLQREQKKINFIAYDAAVPSRLYDAVTALRKHWVTTSQTTTVELLDEALLEDDKLRVMEEAE